MKFFNSIKLIKEEYIKKDYHNIDVSYELIDSKDNKKDIILKLMKALK